MTTTTNEEDMNFAVPKRLEAFLQRLDAFIADEIDPLQKQDDNDRFFDHRREHARTDWDNGGLPRQEWEDLLEEACRRADKAGFLRYGWPCELGGQGGSQLDMAIIREHLAAKGLGLFNDLQNEHSVVANNPFVQMFKAFASEAQYKRDSEALISGDMTVAFGLTEPDHGSDATFMETVARPDVRNGKQGWLITGEKMWTTGMHTATHCMTFARTSGKDGDAAGITCFLVPRDTPGLRIEEYLWTFNMPTDHPRVSFTDVWVPEEAYWGEVGRGLSIAQSFVHQNRIRQAASSLGAATYCVTESLKYAQERKPFGKPLAVNQAIQFPLVELATQCEMLRLLIRKTAWEMDRMEHKQIEQTLSHKVSMCNYWSNRLVCQAADRAVQVHGGLGYSRHKPFEHIYRHHRRYRITEGAEEIQMRKIAGVLFGFIGARK